MENSKRPTPQLVSYLIISVAPLCWAGNIVLARGVYEMIPPVGFAFWRWTIAFVLLLPFTWRTAKRDWPMVSAAWKIMAVLSLLGITGFNTLLYTAVHTTTAINGSLIQSTMPAFILMISLVFFKEKVSYLQIAGLILSMSGAALVVLRGNLAAFRNLSFTTGDSLMILAVLLYALYSVLLRKRPKIDSFSFLTYTFGLGALGLLPLYAWELSAGSSISLNPQVIGSILYVAAFPSILAYLCWNRGIEILGASRGGLFINLIPIFAAAMSIIWLGESLMRYHIYGMMLIFSGMVMFNHNKGK